MMSVTLLFAQASEKSHFLDAELVIYLISDLKIVKYACVNRLN